MAKPNEVRGMSERVEYQCPKCSGTRFFIDVTQSADVDFLPGEEHEVYDVAGDVTWDKDSMACCAQCGEYKFLSAFATKADVGGQPSNAARPQRRRS